MLLMPVLTATAGAIAGAAVAWPLGRRRLVAPPRAPGHEPAPPQAVAVAPPAAFNHGIADDGTLLLEVHLILNVLNRLAVSLVHDDEGQEGLAALADYLRASSVLLRRPSTQTLKETLQNYWVLSRWLKGHEPEPMVWVQDGDDIAPGEMVDIAATVTTALRPLEDAELLELHLELHRETRDGVTRVRIDVEAHRLQMRNSRLPQGLPEGWRWEGALACTEVLYTSRATQ